MRAVTAATLSMALLVCAPAAAADRPIPNCDAVKALPNLVDHHYHLRGVGKRELTLDLAGTESLEAMLAKVEAYAEANPDLPWIVGRGWIETHYDPPMFPTRRDLDRVVSDRPVYLERVDGHAGLANTKALKIAGITKTTKPPFGGKINTDANGELTGIVVDNAEALVTRHIPDMGPTIKDALRVGGQVAQRQGWSGVHAILDSWEEVEALDELFEAGEMPIFVYAAVRWPGAGAERVLNGETIIGKHDGRFTVRAIKINMDGALGSRGAALLEPYADDPGNVGHLTHEPNEVRPVLERALKNGIQVWTHAIGDRANRVVLDLYEETFNKYPDIKPDRRWRIEHAQHLTPEDIPRFAELDVIASMQPSHAIGDLHFAHRRLGYERLKYAYAWRSLLDAGATIIGGSDAPVEVGDSCIEFHAATTRTDLNGFSGEGWNLEQTVPWATSIQLFSDVRVRKHGRSKE